MYICEVEKAETTQELIREDDRATHLLYESGSFKKPLQATDISDKPDIIKELKDGVLYTSWSAILQIKQGLSNLGVLGIMKSNADLMKQFFCFEPPILSSGTCSPYTVIT